MKRSEAIEIVREYYPSSGKDLNEALETLIPELKESEDERIKNFLIGKFREIGEVWHEYSTKDIIAWLKKQGEQNLANSAKTCKDEPKFKVGDWIIRNNEHTGVPVQVIEFKGYYRCELNGEVVTLTLNDVHNNFHLWTIQDVKDGDVIYEKDTLSIILFKSNDCGWIESYCSYWQIKEKFEQGERRYGRASQMTIYPATKEQRDLLFQKMKEAGYEWDAEKKELRKIEQKIAWSEEDEIGFDDAIWAIEQARTIAKDENDMGNLWYAENWLKSLKERVKPQQKPAWSEKNEAVLDALIRRLEGEDIYVSPHLAAECLKSLKSRYTWKPSEQQIGDLEYIMKYYPNIRGMVNSIYADLKKLTE